MARKTKKEKIIADLRRKLQNAPVRSQSVPETVKIIEPPTVQTQSLYIYPVQLIKKDLTKTLLLCILAISLEVALFFVLEKHLILPIRIN